ncbi:hypothetical protein [Micromonospora sp. LA-10]|uniref:hypothetical protein n=1 Tax=Micromonospora sp. LA-10 TaxID=3446364 RepID=UPI003F6EBAED
MTDHPLQAPTLRPPSSRDNAGRSLSLPSTHVALALPWSRAVRRASASMSGSGSMPMTMPTRSASGRVN